jgi:hypothetical protein
MFLAPCIPNPDLPEAFSDNAVLQLIDGVDDLDLGIRNPDVVLESPVHGDVNVILDGHAEDRTVPCHIVVLDVGASAREADSERRARDDH